MECGLLPDPERHHGGGHVSVCVGVGLGHLLGRNHVPRNGLHGEEEMNWTDSFL